MYYTQAGSVDLLKAKWKKLSEYISLECDGHDITHKLKEQGQEQEARSKSTSLFPQDHSVLFLNVPCFGSGTRPWNSAKGAQRIDDGLIEVSLVRLLSGCW